MWMPRIGREAAAWRGIVIMVCCLLTYTSFSRTTSTFRNASESDMRSFYPFVLLTLVLGLWVVSVSAQDAKPPSQSPAASANASGDKAAIDENPVTVKTTSDSQTKKPVDNDPLFGVPPLPPGKTSLVGGTVAKIDGVHNRLGVKVFGHGGRWDVVFDERTHFYRDGSETTFEHVKKGDRVYVDTMLDGHQILARNVRVVTKLGASDARGQVTAFNGGVMTVHDDLSAKAVQFRVGSETQVKGPSTNASINDIQAGSLVAVQFAPGLDGGGVARKITILAAPGQSVTFAGKVMHLDLRNNQLAIENETDSKTYEVALEKNSLPSDLMVGSQVTVAAVFDGRQYKANSISVSKSGQ